MSEGQQGVNVVRNTWANMPVCSDSLDQLAIALSAAQARIKPAARGAENPFFGASYADLESIDAACRTELTAEGFALVQPLETDASTGQLWLYTILFHKSGQHMLSKVQVRVPPYTAKRRRDGSDEEVQPQQLGPQEEAAQARRPQVMGSAITYYRRYALGALVGVVAECEDDDGERTEGRDGGGQKREPMPACPACGDNVSVIRGKAEFGGGFVCWKKSQKRPGCGKSFGAEHADAPTTASATSQPGQAASAPVDVQTELVEAVRILGLTPNQASSVLKGMGYANVKAVTASALSAVMDALHAAANPTVTPPTDAQRALPPCPKCGPRMVVRMPGGDVICAPSKGGCGALLGKVTA